MVMRSMVLMSMRISYWRRCEEVGLRLFVVVPEALDDRC
jgi:hypothetical protein